MEIINVKQTKEKLQIALLNLNNYTCIGTFETMCVDYGIDNTPNLDYCIEHNIECIKYERRGGAFVINAGDLGFANVSVGFNDIGSNLEKEFVEYLIAKNINAVASGNDILVDGYKCFGFATNYLADYGKLLTTCHFTLSVNIDLIKAICTKPMVKVPKGLADYGITQQEVIEFITKFVKKYSL